MATVHDVLRGGAYRGLTALVGPFDEPTDIGDVVAVDDLSEVGTVAEGAMVVWMPRALRNAEPYQLDVAIRGCIGRRHSCVVVMGEASLPMTSRQLATRGGLTVVHAASDTSVAELVLWLTGVVRGGAAETLSRAEAALAALAEVPPDASVDDLLTDVIAALGEPLELVVDTASAGPGAVLIGDRLVGEVVSPPGQQAARLVLPAVAAAVSARRRRELEESFASSQTRAELLAQIAVADDAHLTSLTQQARRLVFPVDLNHVAAWMSFSASTDRTSESDLAVRRRLVDRAELACLEEFLPDSSWCHVSRMGGELLILASDDLDGTALTQRVTGLLERVLARIAQDDSVYLGIGTAARGIAGLRQSAIEARVAADAGRTAARSGRITSFDATGVRRVLADLWASPMSRQIVTDLLAPLDRLGTTLANEAVHTLAVYLDHQSSPKRAAADLHLHPNAVRYRIQRIEEALGLDLGDPDVRFALHLACRMHDLGRVQPAR